MTAEEVAFLTREQTRLISNYETGVVRGKSAYVRGAMSVAYARGMKDVLDLLRQHDFEIIRRDEPLPVLAIKAEQKELPDDVA